MIPTSWQRAAISRRFPGRGPGMPRAGLLLAALLGLTRCAEPAPVTADTRRTAATLPAAAPAAAPGPASPRMQDLDGNGKPVLFNDPPASPDTPLCGRQAAEANAIGTTLQGARVAASGICARFACYDPLTATYIGADGYRHVCR